MIRDDGTVVIRPASHDARDLPGALHREGCEPVTVEAMNAVIRRRPEGD